MKKVMCCIGLLLMAQAGFSQLWKEWFQQKKTQIEYLEKQIVALQAYIQVAQKGYAIYHDGLTVIGDLKDGDFNLHKDYFASLKSVQPFIAGSKQVEEIRDWLRAIEGIQRSVLQLRTPAHHQYLKSVFQSLLVHVNDCYKETTLLTSDGHYELTDEARITLLDKQHALMKDYFGFARWMQQQVSTIVHGDDHDAHDATGLQRLLDIK